MKIFYNPDSLKIMGSSDDEDAMDFPYIETDTAYHSLDNLRIVEDDDNYELEVIVPTMTREIIQRKRGRDRVKKKAVKKLMRRMKAGKVTIRELTEFVINHI